MQQVESKKPQHEILRNQLCYPTFEQILQREALSCNTLLTHASALLHLVTVHSHL